MSRRGALPALALAITVAVWALPLQFGWYASSIISDLPVYERAYDLMSSGLVPYADFSLEYPPLAAGLFWLAGVLPGSYAVVFSVLMMLCLCATVLGVIALARAIGLDPRRQAAAAGLTAIAPLLVGNLVETRFDLALSALLVWTIWAAVTERWRTSWLLLALAILLKLVPVVLIPMLIIWGRHRRGARPAWAGAGGCLAVVAAGIVPFAIMSPSGTWELAKYHLDRPLQVESLGSAYLLGLHAIAGIRVSIEDSFGSQGLDGSGPAVISVLSTAILIGVLVAIAWTLWLGLHRARGPGDARLLVAASAATVAALLVGGKVLSPQFLVWLLPFGFLVAGRYGPAAAVLTASAMLVTLAYFPRHYWDLVALDTGPITLLVVRDLLLIAVLAASWPRPSIAGRPLGRTLGRGVDPKRAERAVSARYLID